MSMFIKLRKSKASRGSTWLQNKGKCVCDHKSHLSKCTSVYRFFLKEKINICEIKVVEDVPLAKNKN